MKIFKINALFLLLVSARSIFAADAIIEEFFPDYKEIIDDYSFDASLNTFAICSRYETIVLRKNGKEHGYIGCSEDQRCSLSADGAMLAVSDRMDDDAFASIWNVQNGKEHTLKLSRHPRALAVSSEEVSILAVMSYKGPSISLINFSNRSLVKELSHGLLDCEGIALSADATLLLAWGAGHNQLGHTAVLISTKDGHVILTSPSTKKILKASFGPAIVLEVEDAKGNREIQKLAVSLTCETHK